MEPPEKLSDFFYFAILCIAIISVFTLILSFNFHNPVLSHDLLYVPGAFLVLILVYSIWIRLGVGQDRTSPMEDGGSRKRHLITSLQLGVAYNLCLHSIQTFPSAKLLESDPEKGTIHARVELTSEVYYSISRRTDGSSEILLEGAIVNEEKFWPDDPRRELLNRQLMNELDYLNGFLVSGISETYGVISSGFAGNVPAPSPRRKSVWISALLSLLSPGMGQHYNGRFIRGIVILILTVFGLIIYLIPGILVWIFGIADAVRLAQKVNDGTYPYVSVPPTMLAAGIVATIPLLAFSLGAFILVAFGKTGVQMIGTFLGW